MQNNKNTLIALISFTVIGAMLLALFFFTLEKPVTGTKTVTVQIKYDEVDRTVVIRTDEEYLRGAMEQENLIKGNDGQYGLFITEVDGRIADSGEQEWWCVTKGGELTSSGVESIVIEDGDTFEFTLTKGW